MSPVIAGCVAANIGVLGLLTGHATSLAVNNWHVHKVHATLKGDFEMIHNQIAGRSLDDSEKKCLRLNLRVIKDQYLKLGLSERECNDIFFPVLQDLNDYPTHQIRGEFNIHLMKLEKRLSALIARPGMLSSDGADQAYWEDQCLKLRKNVRQMQKKNDYRSLLQLVDPIKEKYGYLSLLQSLERREPIYNRMWNMPLTWKVAEAQDEVKAFLQCADKFFDKILA